MRGKFACCLGLVLSVGISTRVLADDVPAPAEGTGAASSGLDLNEEYYCCFETSCCGCPGNRFFAGADFLTWWFQDGPAPALLTTGPATTFPPGALGRPGTVVLANGQNLTPSPFFGGRFFAGWWLDDCQCWGIEARGFFLSQRHTNVTVGSDAYPVLSRPFFDVLDRIQFVESIAQPGFFRGIFQLEAPAQLWGAEGNLRRNACCNDCGWLDVLAGFRYLDLDEGLIASEATQELGAPDAGETRIGQDAFRTSNQFYGGQIGVVAERNFGKFSCQFRGTVGLGCTQQSVTITGAQTRILADGTSTVSPGNLLALPTNIGVWSTERFAVVPEVGINLGFQATQHVRINAGYTFLYWSSVLRPGDQIDLNINPTQIPNFANEPFRGPIAPTVPLTDTGFWAQGVNCGLEFRW